MTGDATDGTSPVQSKCSSFRLALFGLDVLDGGSVIDGLRSYFILNCQMRVLKFTPLFYVREESPIVPIWISFHNIILHFFNAKVLFALGSVFGRPLQTDHATASRTRPSVARILVEVDITKKHAKEIWIGSKAFGYHQKVEFEKVPDFCNHCKTHGYAAAE
ncbi:uncharacterized protein LOC114579536 [Dendrobium catenatum]|uniref:uncharacterized protein LOC114579536 n=1 Tax=Dendrobium catenatum TaxID=906689 RepID=UPI0010A00895|nr:uncharacterized protein LOC114579536 [Dendrobium catenatum]